MSSKAAIGEALSAIVCAMVDFPVRKPVEPEDGRRVRILNPALNPVQYALSRSIQTTIYSRVRIQHDSVRTTLQNQRLGFKIYQFIVFIVQLREPDLDPVLSVRAFASKLLSTHSQAISIVDCPLLCRLGRYISG